MRNKILYNLRLDKINLLLVVLSFFIHFITEFSLELIILVFIFYFLSKFFLKILHLNSPLNLNIFNRVFSISICSLMLASFYRIFLFDSQGDAQRFYEVLIDFDFLSVLLTTNYRENAFPIYCWNLFMNIFEFIGFSRSYYIPVLLNGIIMSLSAILTQSIVIKLYGEDVVRLYRLKLLYTLSGFVWMFSGMLLRDSFVFFLITYNIYLLFPYLQYEVSSFHFFRILFFSVLISIAFIFTRTEYVIMPLFFFIVAYLLKLNNKINFLKALIPITIFLFFLLYSFDFHSIVSQRLNDVGTTYNEGSVDESNSSSLGVSLIINQPIYIRFLFGTITLLIYPIPFWSVMGQNSVYQLYKLLNLFFMLGILLPSVFLSFKLLYVKSFFRTRFNLFSIFIILSVILSISLTSMENRHLGSFMSVLFIFSLIPDYSIKKNTIILNIIRKQLLLLMISIYAIYVLLKLFYL